MTEEREEFDPSDATEQEAKSKAEENVADEERQETETTSQDRLDSATNPDEPGVAPPPHATPKPA
jgi:hypothetical protein